MQTQNKHWTPILLLAGLILLASVYYTQTAPTTLASEQPTTNLELSGAIAVREAELSGLAWHGETLILLPQYPELFGEGDGALFALPKAEILAALEHAALLEPKPIHLNAPGLKESIPNFQGYEAIAFHNDQVFLTIEAGEGTDMHGYLVGGTITENEITLDPKNLIEIPMAFPSDNHTDEAILIMDETILTFFEINGASLNPTPAAHAFDLNLKPQGTVSMPNLEYRLTDSAAKGNDFWVINYFFPGDTDLTPTLDPLTEQYGKGKTHAQQAQVERLVKMTYTPNGITLANTAPIQLTLDGENARNLEGLVLLDEKGFLLVTDKFPDTLLLFVPKP